jgi:hypothetical protein
LPVRCSFSASPTVVRTSIELVGAGISPAQP